MYPVKVGGWCREVVKVQRDEHARIVDMSVINIVWLHFWSTDSLMVNVLVRTRVNRSRNGKGKSNDAKGHRRTHQG